MTKAEKIKEFAQLHLNHAYVYGGTGQPCTPQYRRARQAQYPQFEDAIRKNCPVLNGQKSSCSGCKYQGKKAFDCAQLTRRAAEYAGYTKGTLPSGAKSQFYKVEWAVKKKVSEMSGEEAAGFLYRVKPDGSVPHTGIYIGDGEFIHAKGHRDGVIKQRMGDYPWDYYCTLPEDGHAPISIAAFAPLRVIAGHSLMRGERVRALQNAMIALGFGVGDKGVDGVYGRKTEAAVKAYQMANGIEVDGIVTESLYNAITGARTIYTVVIKGLNQAKKEELTKLYPQAIVQIERM